MTHRQAATQLQDLFHLAAPPEAALLLGSGWAVAGAQLGTLVHEVRAEQVTGFRTTEIAGHHRAIQLREISGRQYLVLPRTHLYEGHGVAAVAHGVRTAASLGVKTLVLTNGCGGLNPEWAPGTAVLIQDSINVTGTSPLVGPEFVDVSDLYSAELRERCRAALPELPEGIYAQMAGPQYETPAEIRMLRTLGADLVGMSTVLEAIAGKAAGMQVLGLSLVTNAAAGMTETLSHADVLAAGQAAAGQAGTLLHTVLTAIRA